ncbi:hypothetical protein C1H46_022367 [Malus baccata]|uniref:Uncharacterized protein n=1 Tax=Malus baccata TaxID=106549 RepID=A0A540M0L1_MALBA|nr:hypothetical protein C1H46_022367 [Malus baccata]
MTNDVGATEDAWENRKRLRCMKIQVKENDDSSGPLVNQNTVRVSRQVVHKLTTTTSSSSANSSMRINPSSMLATTTTALFFRRRQAPVHFSILALFPLFPVCDFLANQSTPPRGLTLFRCANGAHDPGTGLVLLGDFGFAGSVPGD